MFMKASCEAQCAKGRGSFFLIFLSPSIHRNPISEIFPHGLSFFVAVGAAVDVFSVDKLGHLFKDLPFEIGFHRQHQLIDSGPLIKGDYVVAVSVSYAEELAEFCFFRLCHTSVGKEER